MFHRDCRFDVLGTRIAKVTMIRERYKDKGAESFFDGVVPILGAL
jgi:hypothetical protein